MQLFFYSKRGILLFVLVCLFTGFSNQSGAQCNAPTAATFTTITSTCTNNGAIHITGATGGGTAGSLLEYSITASSNPSQPLIAYQNDSNFNSLYPGTYTVSIRYNCSGMHSTAFTSSVTVSGSYQNISSSFSDIKASYCNNGSFSVTAANGYTGVTGNYRYQLVSAQNATQPDPSAVTPVQTTGTFSGLAGTTYYARVFDDCGNFITNAVTIPQGTSADPFQGPICNAYRFIQNIYGCDSSRYIYNGVYVNNYNDLSYPIKFITIMPDSTRDTTFIADPASFTYPSHNITRFINNNQLGPFYQQIVDDCNNVYTSYKLVLDTTKTVNIVASNAFKCTGIEFNFSDLENCNSSCPVPVGNNVYTLGANMFGNYSFDYSLDSGATWIANSTPALIPYNTTYLLYVRLCGKTYITCNPSAVPVIPFEPSPVEDNGFACNGKSGIYLRWTNIGGLQAQQVKVIFSQVPAGQPALPELNALGGPFNNPGSRTNYLFDLIPGKYVYTATDTLCGRTYTDSITITHPHDYTLTAAVQQGCSQGNIQATLTNNTYVAPGFGGPAYGAYFENAYIFNLMDNTGAIISTQTFNNMSSPHTVTFNNMPVGTYYVSVVHDSAWMASTDNCPLYDTVIITNPSVMNLSATLFLTCGGTLGSISMNTTGGIAPYTYELYNGAVSPGNLVTTQSDPLFTGLNTAQTYTVRAIDNCGTGVTVSKSFAPFVPLIQLAGSACTGSALSLQTDSVDGASYSWTKDGNPLSNPSTIYSIPSMSTADYGTYAVTISIPGCNNFSSSKSVGAADCTPLPVTLLSFEGSTRQCRTTLHWKTSNEWNFDHFGIQYSSDGSNFLTLDKVPGKGNQKGSEYSYEARQDGNGFYRLQMVSNNGTERFSKAISVRADCGENPATWSVYPNPQTAGSNPSLRLDASTSLKSVRIVITNLVGSKIFDEMMAVQQLHTVYPLPVAAWHKGIYLISLYDQAGQPAGRPQKLILQ